MPTITFATGFEHRIAANCPGTGVATTAQLWESVDGTPGISTTTFRNGSAALEISAAAATAEAVTWTPAAATRRLIGSLYFRMTNLPTGGDFRITSAVTTAGGQIIKVTTAGVLVAEPAGNGADQVNGPTINTGQWYRLEFDYDTSGTQHTIAWRVDGVAQTTATTTDSPGAQDMTNVRFGTTATAHTNAVTVHYDDAVFSYTAADYPLGEYKVLGYKPNADADITQVGAGAFVDAAAAAISGANPAWDNLLDIGNASATTRVEQTAVAGTGYIEVDMENSAEATDPAAVTFLAAMRADSATQTNGQVQVNDGGTLDTFTGLIDPSETTNVNIWKTRATRPNGGTAWTDAAFDALKMRFGYSTDANPDVWFVGLMLEAAFYVPPPATFAAPPGVLTPHYTRYPLTRR